MHNIGDARDRARLAIARHTRHIGVLLPPSGEVPREAILNRRLFVESHLAFDAPPTGCYDLVGLPSEIGTELGGVLLGVRFGRETDDEITV